MKARKTVVVWKNEEGLKYLFPLILLNISVISKCKRTAKLLMFKSDLRKRGGVCSKSVTKTLCGNKFLVSEYIFKSVYHCEGSRWSEIVEVVEEISLKNLWTDYYYYLS